MRVYAYVFGLFNEHCESFTTSAEANVLNHGCGWTTTEFEKSAHEQGFHGAITNVDLFMYPKSPRNQGKTTVLKSMVALPFEEKTFDCVAMINSSYNHNLVETIQSDALRVLKDKGVIVFIQNISRAAHHPLLVGKFHQTKKNGTAAVVLYEESVTVADWTFNVVVVKKGLVQSITCELPDTRVVTPKFIVTDEAAIY